ncbi:hypothetical protein PVAP13_5NG565600 [Panicum virgatum]|uniref:Uncharacterized protein n=1 Tax=Panicum virgatum TaxID=38727 RepID=A0A8T0S4N3_PANVG|nr:hypothetical protein PVAP13_5NG565600 [Panicum virgatum]
MALQLRLSSARPAHLLIIRSGSVSPSAEHPPRRRPLPPPPRQGARVAQLPHLRTTLPIAGHYRLLPARPRRGSRREATVDPHRQSTRRSPSPEVPRPLLPAVPPAAARLSCPPRGRICLPPVGLVRQPQRI